MENTQNYCDFGLCPSSGIPETREYNVSETGSVSVLRWGVGETPTLLGPLERANLNHWTNPVILSITYHHQNPLECTCKWKSLLWTPEAFVYVSLSVYWRYISQRFNFDIPLRHGSSCVTRRVKVDGWFDDNCVVHRGNWSGKSISLSFKTDFSLYLTWVSS
jgi:hypothetical protein